jgi:hypothetical protein
MRGQVPSPNNWKVGGDRWGDPGVSDERLDKRLGSRAACRYGSAGMPQFAPWRCGVGADKNG